MPSTASKTYQIELIFFMYACNENQITILYAVVLSFSSSGANCPEIGGGIVLKLGGNCPDIGGELSGANCPGGELSGGRIV